MAWQLDEDRAKDRPEPFFVQLPLQIARQESVQEDDRGSLRIAAINDMQLAHTVEPPGFGAR